MNVKIYGRNSGCKYCDMAKDLCKREQFDVEFIDLATNDIDGAKLSEICGTPVRTVPQIFVDEQYVGGWTEFNAKVKSEKGE